MVNSFSVLLLYKINVFNFFNMVDFFPIFFYREVLKFWSYQIFNWDCIRKAFLSVEKMYKKFIIKFYKNKSSYTERKIQ